MAAKKSDSSKKTETPTPKKAAPKAATKKSAAPKKAAAPEAAAKPAEAPKPAPAKPAPAKPAAKEAPKKAAPVKLTEKQLDFLKTIHGAEASGGYLLSKKAEQRTIDALLDRKLIKRGPKDKESGNYRYSVSKAGEKHLSSQPSA